MDASSSIDAINVLLYITAPSLLIAVVLAAVWLDRWSVPVIVVALGAGIVFGNDVLNFYEFSNFSAANLLANIALVFILFHGGFSTRREDFKSVALPAGGLATWGVVLTAIFSYIVLHWGFNWSNEKALLLAVIVSSTDAAAIFSILRRQSLPAKLSSTVEIESAANDPMAILLTTIAVTAFAAGTSVNIQMLAGFLWQFAAGPAIGLAVGWGAVWLFNRLTPEDRGYYYVLFLGLVPITYGMADFVQASGMLAVFTAGYVMGNSSFVHKQGIRNFSEALSTIGNIGMFAMLGLLVSPASWTDFWLQGVLLFIVVTFIARPLAVFLGTLGMKLGTKNKLFISWAGLRGSVPIVLATYPAAAGLEIGIEVFNLVFVAVLLSIVLQGSTLGAVAKWLNLSAPSRPKPLYQLELMTMTSSDYDLVTVELPGPPGARGPRIRELCLPEGAVITMVTRGSEIVLPKGNTYLCGWDHVTILAHAPDAAEVRKALKQPFWQLEERARAEAHAEELLGES